MQHKFDDIYELTPLQEGILFHALTESSASTYMEQYSFTVRGKLDTSKFNQAFNLIFKRHDILRTSFVFDKVEKPLQVVMKHREITVDVHDIRYLDDEGKQQYIEAFRLRDRGQSFDMVKGPLMRVSLIRYDEQEYRLIWTWHHILFDGWCTRLLASEVVVTYHCLVKDVAPVLPTPVPFKTYIKWLGGIPYQKAADYWNNYVKGFSIVSRLLGSENIIQEKGYHKVNQDYYFDPVLSSRIVATAKSQQVTQSILLKTVWALLLARYNNNDDILFGAVVSGRPPSIPDVERIIGLFINTIPVRFCFQEEDTFATVLARAQKEAAATSEFHHFPLVQTQQFSETKSGLFNHLFSFQNYPETAAGNEGDSHLDITDLEIFDQTSYDFEISFFPGQRLLAKVGFNSNVYLPAVVDEIMAHFTHLLELVLASPFLPVHTYNILTPRQQQDVLAISTGSIVPFNSHVTVDMLIDAYCVQTPDQVAIRMGEITTTYGELYAQSNQIAHYLQERGIGKDDVVAILMERQFLFIAGMLGIWKANAAYMPLDVSLPVERMKEILKAANARFLIISSSFVQVADILVWECPLLEGALCMDQPNTGAFFNQERYQELNAFWEAVASDGNDDITKGGWFSSYTGQPLSIDEMNEYAENVKIKLQPFLHPDTRVLEIGCGSGFTMFNLAPYVKDYVAIDHSAITLSENAAVIEKNGITNILQLHLAAHEVAAVPGSFDVIILNSVIQDFGHLQYLRDVLSAAIALLNDRGIIFLGDIMDLDLKQELLQSLTAFKNQHSDNGYITKLHWEEELFVSKRFWNDLIFDFPAIHQVGHSQKIGQLENELTLFRYDTILHIEKTKVKQADNTVRCKNRDFENALLQYRDLPFTGRVPSENDLAYILFTSGSTGVPKGVMITHGSMLNHKLGMIREFNITSSTVLAQTAAVSFDISVWQLVTALMKGGTIAIYPSSLILEVNHFLTAIAEDQVSILEIVPSYLQLVLEEIELSGIELPALQYLITTGEAVAPVLIEKWFSYFPHVKVVNAYGPAEAGDDVSLHFMESMPQGNIVAIGRPFQNLSIYILNKAGQLCPPDVQGEICVAGAGVGRGYINVSADGAFTTDPFNAGARMYKTGDLGKYGRDGLLYYSGRKDNQVKVRGYRIEPGEIDACLMGIAGIGMACTLLKEEDGKEPWLCSYVTCMDDRMLYTEQLQDDLRKVLPEYMVPGKIYILDEMPLLHNGKVDRKTLMARKETATGKIRGQQALTIVEAAVANIWAEVLNVQQVYPEDNFFELGGHSLKAIRLVSRINKAFSVSIKLRDIFYYPGLSAFSAAVEKAKTAVYAEIPVLPLQDRYEASHAQRRLWVLSQFEATSVAYNECDAYEITGHFNKQYFVQAIRLLVERHEILRTSFEEIDHQLYQRVHAADAYAAGFRYVNLSAEIDPDTEIARITDLLVHERFDLRQGPLLKIMLIRVTDERHVVLTSMHHIINDGWSDSVFIHDLISIYAAISEGKAIPLKPLRIHYKEFAAWQNHQLRGEKMQVHEDYWLERLQRSWPVLELPATYERPDNITYNGDETAFSFSPATAAQLKEFSNRHGITLFSTLIAVLNVLFNKYTGEEDIIIGTYNGSRDHTELEDQIGFYINTLVLDNKVNPDGDFVSFARQVGQNSIAALEHRVYPFDMLIDKIEVNRDLSRAPLFDVLAGLQNFHDTIRRQIDFVADFQVSRLKVNKMTSIYDLNFMFMEEPGGLRLNVRYNTDIYTGADIDRIFRHYQQLAGWLMSRPFAKIRKAVYLTSEDMAELRQFNQQNSWNLNHLMPAVIRQHSLERPEMVAVACGSEVMTYSELEREMSGIAGMIHSAPGNKVVGVLADRSLLWAGAMQGIWAAGGIYLPLNPADPIDRLLHYLNDADVSILIYSQPYASLASILQWRADNLYTIYCADHPSPYSLVNTERDRLSRQVWEFMGDKATDKIQGGGWINSYTGQPFSKEEMAEYAANVQLKLQPFIHSGAKVLEIGCASGITMFEIAPFVKEYVATDISEVILEKNQQEIHRRGLNNIRSYCLAAIDISRLEEKDFDIVIINSVVQNFGDYNYLRQVIVSCIELSADNGVIFLGDLMDEDKRMAMEQSFSQYAIAHPDMTGIKTDWSAELFVKKGFLDNLQKQLLQVNEVHHSSKIYSISNELTTFRYDSILLLDKQASENLVYDGVVYQQLGCRDRQVMNYMSEIHPQQAAYIIYTSGSTGKPKGALVSHAGMMNHLLSKQEVLGTNDQSRIAQSASQTFDVSVWQLLLGIYSGGTTYIFEKDIVLDIPAFIRQLVLYKISILEVVPSYLSTLLYYLEQHSDLFLPDLKTLVSCGEILTPQLANRWFKLYPDTPLLNAYGPTEASCDITHHLLTQPVYTKRVHVGRALPNLRVSIVNDDMQLCSLNVKGEIVVAGIGVGLGYVNNRERTEAVFLKDTLENTGERLYKTGDIGRLLPSGEIDFLGRKDHQVKVRGVRIELGEIEAVISKTIPVKECVVIAREEAGEWRLVAFVVPQEDRGMTSDFLRQRLLRHLPVHLLPETFIFLPQLPVLTNGKTDRKTLAGYQLSDIEATDVAEEFTHLERQVFNLWQEVIGHGGFRKTDNFFSAGGHSLKAMRLIALIEERMNVSVSFRDLFIHSTLEKMAHLINLSVYNQYNHIEPVGKRENYALSGSQQRLWILCQFREASIAYNQFSAYRINGNFDLLKMQEAFRLLLERHEILRTVIVTINEEPVQRILPVETCIQALTYTDGTEEQDISKIGMEEQVTAFDIENGPLFRIRMIQGKDGVYVMLTIHHLITDGWSFAIFMHDLFNFYNGRQLPPLVIQYKDYAAWKNNQVKGAWGKRASDFWKSILAGELPRIELSTTKARPGLQTYDGASLYYHFEEETCKAVAKLQQVFGQSTFIVLNTLVDLLFYKLTGKTDLITGTILAGREQAATHPLIGLFVNTIPIRLGFDPASSLTALFKKAGNDIQEALSYGQYPFDLLLDDLKINRDLSRSPLFDIVVEYHAFDNIFNWQQAATVSTGNIEQLSFGNKHSLFDLSFIFKGQPEALALELEYNTNIYSKEELNMYVTWLQDIIRRVPACLNQTVSSFKLLSLQEEQAIISNGTGPVVPTDYNRTVDVLIDEMFRRYPDHTAVVYGEKRLSYDELFRNSNQLAHYLLEAKLKKEDVVGVLMDRQPAFTTCMLGIWKANAAYMPLEPSLPYARMRDMIQAAGTKWLIYGSPYKAVAMQLLEECNSLLGGICSEDFDVLDKYESAAVLGRVPDGKALAYILFTSGSTGAAKGVMIEHGNMLNHNMAKIDIMNMQAGVILAQTASISFDISIWQFITALICGGTSIIYPSSLILETGGLLQRLVADKVEILEVVPGYLQLLLDVAQESGAQLPNLRYLMTTGETVSPVLIQRWFSCFPDIPVINAYGPSEAADDITHCIMHTLPDTSTIPVGTTIRNMRIYILDEGGNICPPGIQGEICVAGAGIGRGYINVSAGKAFTDDPFYAGDRMYKTGDIGRMTNSGVLFFAGRRDSQIKIRGHRIELDEISSKINSVQGVGLSCVLMPDASHIYAFITAARGKQITGGRVQEELRELLPDYMVPSQIIVVESMPLLPSGKIDRKELLMGLRQQHEGKNDSWPETTMEKKIAAIWQEVLNIDRIRLDDNFYELGGDSLSLVKIFRKVSKEYPIRLQLEDYFVSRTIRELADKLLRKGTRSFGRDDDGSLFYLQRGIDPGKRNLFLFPPAGGLGIYYRDLVRYLDPGYNCHLFNYRGIGKHEVPFTDLEDVLSYYAGIIQEQIAPGDVINLVGVSSGGNLIFELAGYLERNGQPCLLMMLDAEPTIVEEKEEFIDGYITSVGEFVNDTEQGKVFMSRYEDALRAYMRIFNSTMQDSRKKIASDIVNFICRDSSFEVKLWGDYTHGDVSYITLENGSHQDFIESKENLILIADKITQILLSRTIINEQHANNVRKMV